MHHTRERNGYKRHAFEAIVMTPDGRESLIATFPVTKKRNAAEARRMAEERCELIRSAQWRSGSACFVREINAGKG